MQHAHFLYDSYIRHMQVYRHAYARHIIAIQICVATYSHAHVATYIPIYIHTYITIDI